MSGSDDKTVPLWDVGTGSHIGEAFCEHTDRVTSVSFSNDEHEIFSVGEDDALCVWRMDGNLDRRVQFAEEEVYMRDAKIICGGEKVIWCDDHWVYVTGVRSELSAIACSNQHKDAVSAMCVSPDGARVISGSEDETLMVWDTATGLQVGTTIEGHESWVNDVTVTPDGQRFVSVSSAGRLCVWDLDTNEQLAVLKGHSSGLNCVDISADGRTTITGFRDGTVQMWDLDAFDGSHKVLEGHLDAVERLYLAEDGQHFVSLSWTETILWNMETAELVKQIGTVGADSMSVDEI